MKNIVHWITEKNNDVKNHVCENVCMTLAREARKMFLRSVSDDHAVYRQSDAYMKLSVDAVGHCNEFRWLHLQIYISSITGSRFEFNFYMNSLPILALCRHAVYMKKDIGGIWRGLFFKRLCVREMCKMKAMK